MPKQAPKALDQEWVVGPQGKTITIHGSSTGGAKIGIARNLQSAKSGDTLSGDHNQDFLDPKVLKEYIRQLALKKLAISSDTLDQLFLSLKTTVKFRLEGAQYGKINELMVKCVEAAHPLEALKTLDKNTVCAKRVLYKDPRAMKRTELLKITEGRPTFIKFENQVYFITDIGTVLDVKSIDSQKTQLQISISEPKELVSNNPKTYAKKHTYILHNGAVYLIDGHEKEITIAPVKLKDNSRAGLEKLFTSTTAEEASDEDLDTLNKIIAEIPLGPNESALRGLFEGKETDLTLNELETIKTVADFEPCQSPICLELLEAYERAGDEAKDFKTKAEAIFKTATPDTVVKEIGDLIKKDYPHYNYFYDNADKNDHPTTISITEDNVRIDVNSASHADSNANHFSFQCSKDALKVENYIKQVMYTAYRGMVLRHALVKFANRGTTEKYTFEPPENFQALLNEDTLVQPPYTREQLALWKIPEEHRENLMMPCRVPAHYPQLLDLYQKCLKGSGQTGSLTASSFDEMFKDIYASEEFNRINSLLAKPFFGYKPTYFNATDLKGYKENPTLAKVVENLLTKFPEIKRAIQKAFNSTLGLIEEIRPPKEGEAEFDFNGGGFGPLRKPDGSVYTAKELTQIQIDHLVAHIHRQHQLHPNKTITVGLIEAGNQEEKKRTIALHVSTINDYLAIKGLKNEAAKQAERRYNQLISDVATNQDIQAYIKDITAKEASFLSRVRPAKQNLEVKGEPPVSNAKEVKGEPPVSNSEEVKREPAVLNPEEVKGEPAVSNSEQVQEQQQIITPSKKASASVSTFFAPPVEKDPNTVTVHVAEEATPVNAVSPAGSPKSEGMFSSPATPKEQPLTEHPTTPALQ